MNCGEIKRGKELKVNRRREFNSKVGYLIIFPEKDLRRLCLREVSRCIVIDLKANIIVFTLPQWLFFCVLHILHKNPNPCLQQHFFQE